MSADDSVPPNPPVQPVSFSGRYLVIVGGLLILIIAMLAFLWSRERSQRVKAEGYAHDLEMKIERDKQNLAQMMLSQMVRPGLEDHGVRPFQRQDHVSVPVTLDGAKRAAYRLPAAAAERFGFQAGDVIVVEPAAAGAPSTRPLPEATSAPAGG